MRIYPFALAAMLLIAPAYAVDQLIKLPKPEDLNGPSHEQTRKAPVAPADSGVAGKEQSDAAKQGERVPGKDGAAPSQRMSANHAAPVPRTKSQPVARRPTTAGVDEEQQIQELAEKISARLAALRKAKEAQAALAPRKKLVNHIVPASHSGKTREHAHVHWGYEGENGPSHWGKLNPAWGKCDTGNRQSPIDIRDGIRLDLEPVHFDYRASPFTVIDTGHTVQVTVPEGNTISLAGRSYELAQFHFHLPSEERLNGKSYPMSMHFMHKAADGRHAIVAVLVEEGSSHAGVQQVWNNLPLEKHDPVRATSMLNLLKLLPVRREYYTYMGSFTTPPCSEGVLWIVLKEPIQLSSQQIAIFSRLYAMNARPIQATANRLIKESN